MGPPLCSVVKNPPINSGAVAAATAKSLHSCPTLHNPMDCSPSIRGIFQARVLEWGAIAFSIGVRVGQIERVAWKHVHYHV